MWKYFVFWEWGAKNLEVNQNILKEFMSTCSKVLVKLAEPWIDKYRMWLKLFYSGKGEVSLLLFAAPLCMILCPPMQWLWCSLDSLKFVQFTKPVKSNLLVFAALVFCQIGELSGVSEK